MILRKFIHKLDEFSLEEMIISKKYRSVKLKKNEGKAVLNTLDKLGLRKITKKKKSSYFEISSGFNAYLVHPGVIYYKFTT